MYLLFRKLRGSYRGPVHISGVGSGTHQRGRIEVEIGALGCVSRPVPRASFRHTTIRRGPRYNKSARLGLATIIRD